MSKFHTPTLILITLCLVLAAPAMKPAEAGDYIPISGKLPVASVTVNGSVYLCLMPYKDLLEATYGGVAVIAPLEDVIAAAPDASGANAFVMLGCHADTGPMSDLVAKGYGTKTDVPSAWPNASFNAVYEN